jgi:hypothetical protein
VENNRNYTYRVDMPLKGLIFHFVSNVQAQEVSMKGSENCTERHFLGWWSGSRSKSTHLANLRPCVQTPVPPKEREKEKKHFFQSYTYIYLFSFLFFLWYGVELKAYTLSHSIIFVKGFFEIGSGKLFAWAGFETQSS